MTVSRKELDDNANRLLQEIANHSGSFELEEVAEFANGINADLSKKYIKEHLIEIKKVLDAYEKELLDRALKSVF